MAIDRKDAEGQEDREAADRERAEIKAELEAERKARQESDLARVRAEAEAEVLKKFSSRQETQPTAWTDEHWEAEAQRRGMGEGGGRQLKVIAEVAGGFAEVKTREAKEEAEQAKKEAREAREEARKVKSDASLFSVEQEFYSKNPEFSGRKGDIAEFMGLLPEESKNDPKKYSEALEKAKFFVRGKARENIQSKRTSRDTLSRTVSEDRSHADGETQVDDSYEFDGTDLSDGEVAYAQRTIKNIQKNPDGAKEYDRLFDKSRNRIVMESEDQMTFKKK